MAFHDLTKGKVVPKIVKQLLELSRKFIPVKDHSQCSDDLEEALHRFERDCHLKVFFADSPLDNKPPPLYVKSIWRPPLSAIPQEVDTRLYRFFRLLRSMFIKRKGVTNLLPFQTRLLDWLKTHESWIVANTDKNLGPCVIELAQYVLDALTHLNNPAVYEYLTEAKAKATARSLERDIYDWTTYGRKKLALDDHEVKYIRKTTTENSKDPFGYFYLLYKVHKKTLSTRPVCSDCASITNPIGKWVDIMLQPIAQKMPTYFKDSFAFKNILDGIVAPTGARLCTADAVSMYTNIDTNAALSQLAPYLRANEKEFGHYHSSTLIRALELVMKNNIIRFGDMYVRQVSGTAMGKPPAPPWATIFEGLHEMIFLPKWAAFLQLYKRFIDDVYCIWNPPADLSLVDAEAKWVEFKAEVNNNHGLEWEFSERALSGVEFLDMSTSICSDGTIKTTLYEKPMALYLFIPPHSAHPPGVLPGHVFGNILRIFRLNSDEEDIVDDTVKFYHRFLQRGHTCDVLKPLFLAAKENARKFMLLSIEEKAAIKEQKLRDSQRRLYLHVEHHPQNPTSTQIQQLFSDTVLTPSGAKPLNKMDAGCGGDITIPIDAMVIAYHRAPNFGDHFSYRDVSKKKGPPVSSYTL